MPADAATVEVVATSGLTFVPADVTINQGDSVHWTGLAGGFHTVHEVDTPTSNTWNGGFHSAVGASEFTRMFSTPGVYYYICQPHVTFGMRGTVTVNELIPTVSEWGLLVMTVLIIGVGIVLLRRTQRQAAA